MTPPAARVALITGAGRGIGRALTLGLARAGVAVGLLGRTWSTLEEAAAAARLAGAPDVALATADVRSCAQVAAAVEEVEAALGGVDLLVNNAGIIDATEVPVWEADPDEWWQVVETDLRGPFNGVRAVAPGMIARGGGRVIDLNSGAGTSDRDVHSAYSAAKVALFRMTGSIHLAGFDRGLRAFELSPGVVRSDMTASMARHADRTEWTPPEAVVELAVAIAAGTLDAWSGCFLRAGVDTPATLAAAAREGVEPGARRLRVTPYGPHDPLS